MNTEAETEESTERETIRIVYIGPSSKAGSNVWRMPDGTTGVFSKLKGRVPGGIYSVEATGGGQTVYPNTLRYTGELADDAVQLQVDALDKERALAAVAPSARQVCADARERT